MTARQLLDELELEISKRKWGNKEYRRCGEIIHALRGVVGFFDGNDERFFQSKKQMLANADIVAQNTIKEAETRAQRLAENCEITRLARRKEREIEGETYRKCEQIVLESKERIQRLLDEAEERLRSALDAIALRRETLRTEDFMQKKP